MNTFLLQVHSKRIDQEEKSAHLIHFFLQVTSPLLVFPISEHRLTAEKLFRNCLRY